jgi:hypothetical protein
VPTAAISVASLPLNPGTVAAAGALEIAVHGWDISHACGHHRHIPYPLAADLLEICPDMVPAERHPLFDPEIPAPPSASPSDRLVAYLGRPPCPQAPQPRQDLDTRLAAIVTRLAAAKAVPTTPAGDEPEAPSGPADG